jgi:hypothetical protein
MSGVMVGGYDMNNLRYTDDTVLIATSVVIVVIDPVAY